MSFTVDRLMAPSTDRKPVVVVKKDFYDEPRVRFGGEFKSKFHEDKVKIEDCKSASVVGELEPAKVASLLDKNAGKQEKEFATTAVKNEKAGNTTKEADNRHVETFVAVIAQAILSAAGKRMTLSSIYNYIASNYSHFNREKGPGWRNSVRHNLSSNDCFVKAGRAENGKGHYWMIHPKDIPEFSKGNFRRRRKPRRPRCHHAVMFNGGSADNAGFFYHTLAATSMPLSMRTASQDRLVASPPLGYGLVTESGKLPLVGHYDRPQYLDMTRATGLTVPPSALFWPGEISSRTYPKFASAGAPMNYHQFCACHSSSLPCYYHKC